MVSSSTFNATPRHPPGQNTFVGVSTFNRGPVVFPSALENSKGERCFLIWDCKESFFSDGGWILATRMSADEHDTHAPHYLWRTLAFPVAPAASTNCSHQAEKHRAGSELAECAVLSYCSRVKCLPSTHLLSAVSDYVCPVPCYWGRQWRAKFLALN